MRRLVVLAALACSVVALAACGGGNGGGSGASSTSTTATPRSPFQGGQQRPQVDPSAFSAFRDCLRKHGVSLPSGPPQGAGPGSAPSPDAKTQAAFQACVHLLPAGPQATPNA